MRYVPNLIPVEHKVLKDYFKGNLYTRKKSNKLLTIICWVIGVFLISGAFTSIGHPVMFLIYGLIGLILIPPGQEFIEKKLKFNFNNKIKSIFGVGLFLLSIPLNQHYTEVDKQDAIKQKSFDENVKREQIIANKKEVQRKDSLNFYISSVKKLSESHRGTDALKTLNYATIFVKLGNEKSTLAKLKNTVLSNKILDQIQNGKYIDVLPEVERLLATDSNNTDFLYNRALCFSKIGKTKEAVVDLKNAIELGCEKADKLHNKINPIRKKIIGYETLCCDGSTSNNNGRGACSRHDGVCDWNHPIYVEYRKY